MKYKPPFLFLTFFLLLSIPQAIQAAQCCKAYSGSTALPYCASLTAPTCGSLGTPPGGTHYSAVTCETTPDCPGFIAPAPGAAPTEGQCCEEVGAGGRQLSCRPLGTALSCTPPTGAPLGSAYRMVPCSTTPNCFPAPLLEEPTFEPTLPRLQIPVPTLRPFTKPLKTVTPEGKTVLVIDFLTTYIVGIYKYLVGIAGIMAGVMIVWAGIKWLTSAGNPERIGDARKKIASALMGLILVLGSYVVLNLVNPDLVFLKPLRVEFVEPILLDLSAMENTVPPGDVDTAPPAGAGFNGVPAFKQSQEPWRTQPYGDCGGHAGKASYAYSACGATSLAMVLKFHGLNVDPMSVGSWAVENGYRQCGKGTSPGLMTNVDKNPAWANMVGEPVNGQEALEFLSQRKPIIFATPEIKLDETKKCYKKGGHYMLATGIDEQGRVRVNDPATCGRAFGGFNGEDGVWAGANGEGVTALTKEKFLRGSIGWYVHPK